MNLFSSFIAKPNRQQTLALAGVFQSAVLTDQLATKDRYDVGALHESAYSLIKLDSESVDEVYGSVYGVDLGLRSIVKLFSSRPDINTRNLYQYVAGVHQLSMKLSQLERTATVIQVELQEIGNQYLSSYNEQEQDDAFFKALSDLYSRTISFLKPRIIVQGSGSKLQQPEAVNKVRTALFAGIRSAYLWHQLGGRRWHLLFNRTLYVHQAQRLLVG